MNIINAYTFRWAGKVSSMLCGVFVVLPDIQKGVGSITLGSLPLGKALVIASGIIACIYMGGVIKNSW